MSYQDTRNTRRENRSPSGRIRGGKLAPVMCVPIKGNESGVLSQEITFELDPIMGRMITPITGQLIAVFVPVQAIDAIKNPDADYAGLTEVIREKLLSGNPLFGLENEGEISKRLYVTPRSIEGVKKVNEMVRLGHNAAVNFLRMEKFDKATLLPHTNTAVTPALISSTILQRTNGVLDPDDHINGRVQLSSNSMRLPLSGPSDVRLKGTIEDRGKQRLVKINDGVSAGTVTPVNVASRSGGNGATLTSQNGGTGQNSANSFVVDPAGSMDIDLSKIFAEVEGFTAGGVSLTDFYNAERMDAMTRQMRAMLDANKQYGEEVIMRWAHGLSVDNGKVPFTIAERREIFGRSLVQAMDQVGIQDDTIRSDMALKLAFTVPVPRTELGGLVITFACILPDETIGQQPHPILSDVWGADNFVADELALDPVAVTIRELDADCLPEQEATPMLYTGLNALKQTYVQYGFNRHVDVTTVAEKTALWQLELPISVTPDNIIYPEELDHYPFQMQNAEVCIYTLVSNVTLQTPMIFGPTPVEEMAVLKTEDLFEDQ